MPDASTSLEETLEAVNTLHKEGKFERFGVSNYSAAQVDDFCAIADKKGWIKPTAYQGIYNALHRSVEKELFPVLRKHGISFYEFNPLGGGASSPCQPFLAAQHCGRLSTCQALWLTELSARQASSRASSSGTTRLRRARASIPTPRRARTTVSATVRLRSIPMAPEAG